jgi:hypothetical protein
MNEARTDYTSARASYSFHESAFMQQAETKHSIIPAVFEGTVLQFRDDGWFNATSASARYGKEPSEWLRLPGTMEYIAALQEAEISNPGLSRIWLSTKRGNNGGTWLHPKLAILFARWLDVRFAVWCDEQIESIVREKKESPAPDVTIPAAVNIAMAILPFLRAIGLDNNAAAISANQTAIQVTGVNLLELSGNGYMLAINQEDKALTPTELGKLAGGVSAKAMNKRLEAAGMQIKAGSQWEPTDSAKGHYRLYDTGKKHDSGTPVTQMKWFKSVLPLI